MKAIHKRRLLNVARALRESKEPDKFTMRKFGHPCGTPACALGHYAARHDLQRSFELRALSDGTAWAFRRGEKHPWVETALVYCRDPVLGHFGIDDNESHNLFGAGGCGDAQTANEAALYIERFVKRKERER